MNIKKQYINWHENIDYKYFLLTVDDNYIEVASCLIESLRINTLKKLCFIIFTESLNVKTIDSLYNLNISFIIYYIDRKEIGIIYDEKKYIWPYVSFFRIIAPFVIDEKIEYLYYLDGDMLCINSLDELFELEIPKTIAMCPELQLSAEKNHLSKLDNSFLYCNSGFVIFNIHEFKKNYNFKNIVNDLNCRLNSYKYPDQDFLNFYFKNDIIYLNPFKFNNMPYHYKGARSFKKILSNAIIIHCTSFKPWNYKCSLDFAKIYLKYCPNKKMKKTIRKKMIVHIFLNPIRLLVKKIRG